MKLTKRICALLLSALMLCSLLCACGEGDPQGTGEPSGDSVSYQVTVVDGLGTPYSEKVIVKFMQNGTQVAMASVDATGTAKKDLPAGDYTVQVDTTVSGAECWFDAEKAVLTADAPQLELTMAYAASGEASSLTATVPGTDVSKEYQAPDVGTGSVYVPLTAGDRSYVIFTPTEGGIYRFTVTGEADVGYYGAPHFVQPHNLGEMEDNSFSVSVADSGINEDGSGTTRLVIGLDAREGAEGAILNIQRTGDKEWTIEDEPWINYQPKREITPYTLPEGVTLKNFELTAPTFAYNLVLNETDRCYHLNSADGAPVFVQLDRECYGISMKAMVGEIIYQDGVLMQSGTSSFRYMYCNSPEDFFKEDYTDAMRQYVTNRDPQSGVYPLTEDLYYMMKMGIEFMGWCDPDHSNYRFAEVPGINNEISWLFLCMFVDQGQIVLPLPEEPTVPGTTEPDNLVNPGTTNPGTTNPGTTNPGTTNPGTTNPGTTNPGTTNPGTTNPGTTVDPGVSGPTVPAEPIHDNKSSPIEKGGTLEFQATVMPGHLVYYALYRVSDTTLTINSNDAYVIYKGKTYAPVNGVVTVPGLYSESTNIPVKLAVGNMGAAQQTFYATMSYPIGHRTNPYQMAPGTVSTWSAEGNSQGVYYTYQAPSAGTLSITLDSVSGGHNADISITSEITEGGTPSVNLSGNGDADGKTVSMELSAGERVIVAISVLPENGFNYPEATVQTTVNFG